MQLNSIIGVVFIFDLFVAYKKSKDQMLPISPRQYLIICGRRVTEFNFCNFYILLSGVSLEEQESRIGHFAKMVFDLQGSRIRSSALGISLNPTP